MWKHTLLAVALLCGCATVPDYKDLQFEDHKLDTERRMDHTLEEDLKARGARVKGFIKTWTSGETLRSADLNSNFAHIHGLMVGGHGARLVDADVSGVAAISRDKLSPGALIPRAWAFFNTPCAQPCAETLVASSGVSGIQHTGVGTWTVTWTTGRTNANYAVFITANNNANSILCKLTTASTATVAYVGCFTTNTAAAVETAFSVMLMDDN